jgi:hypothetical protein
MARSLRVSQQSIEAVKQAMVFHDSFSAGDKVSTLTKLNINLSLRVKRSVTKQSQGFELNQINLRKHKYFCLST